MLQSYPASLTPETISEVEAEVASAIERLRSLLFELRPSALDREGLAPALRIYLEHTAQATGWRVDVVDGLETMPSPDMAALLYRIAQEAVVNARKHAEASSVIAEVGNAADGVIVRIVDDGRGFVPDLATAPAPGHLGLSTMQERAELSGGWVRVTSAPGEGTSVECWLPVDVEGGDRELGSA
jgi:signal transduction histidine kinase